MAYNFGEVLAQQAQQNAVLQAQNRQNAMQMIQQLQAQAAQNQERMIGFQQRERELALQDRVRAFQEAQAERNFQLESRKLKTEEDLVKFRQELLGAQKKSEEAQAGYYGAKAADESALAKSRGVQKAATGAASFYNAARKTYSDLDEKATEELYGLESALATAEENLKDALDTFGWTSKSDQRDIDAAQKRVDDLKAQINPLKTGISERKLKLLGMTQDFSKKYGIDPESYIQQAQAPAGSPAPMAPGAPADTSRAGRYNIPRTE